MNPLTSALSELEALQQRKAEIERKIEAVTKSIKLLEPVYAQERYNRLMGLDVMRAEIEDVGMTEAVLRVLMASAEGLYPTQVRDSLVENGFEIRSSNPMATVHTVLKRLAAKPDGSVVAEEVSGKIWYKYIARAAADYMKHQQPRPMKRSSL
jgi:hypothetical protein